MSPKKVSTKKKVKSTKRPIKKEKVASPTIYIQIASYRDPELLPTLRDCINNAAHPKNLRFGILWQHAKEDTWDTLTEFKKDTRFRIVDVDYMDAKGVCWARAELNKLYKNETYVLQLDSHHRFTKNWDTILINMLEQLRSDTCKSPLLSSYLPSYDPSTWPNVRTTEPWYMEFDRFAPEGPIHFLPHTIDDWKTRNRPIPSRFVSAHFIFADGRFVKDVPYNPVYYFHGEEIDLSVRSYMAGYDIFAPHKIIIWHEYHRNGKRRHWDDHKNWLELDLASFQHLRNFYGIDNKSLDYVTPKHIRSLQEYEMFAGLEFKTRRVHKLTVEKVKPPISLDIKSHWLGLTHFHKVCIDVYRPEFKENDYTFWAVAIEDINGVEIYRQDADKNEITNILAIPFEEDNFSHIWRTFYNQSQPVRWVVWPHSESKGWCSKITGTFSKQ